MGVVAEGLGKGVFWLAQVCLASKYMYISEQKNRMTIVDMDTNKASQKHTSAQCFVSHFPNVAGAPCEIRESCARASACWSTKSANLSMMSRLWSPGVFFHDENAFSAAATAASTSCSLARGTSSVSQEPSLGLWSVSFLEDLESTYSLLMKSCFGRDLGEKGKVDVVVDDDDAVIL